jgi:hypothetical protein
MPPNSLIDEKKYSPDHKGQKITELRSKKPFFLTKKKQSDNRPTVEGISVEV